MKLKFILSLAMLVIATTAFSQTGQLRRGMASYEKFSEVKSLGSPELGMNDLKAALTALERAIEHDRTKDLAETWTYYALVKADLALLDSEEDNAEEFKTALEARQKAIELDTENEQEQNLEVLSFLLAQYELNQGVAAWEVEDFATAYEAFNRGGEYLPGDTTFLFYAGLAAVQSGNYQNAIEKYKEIVPIDTFSEHRQIVLDISRLYMMEGDTANAINYANIGRDIYPEDSEMASQFIELNLIAGNEVEVISTIEAESNRDPQNKILHYYLGLAHSEAGNEEQAEIAYKKALEIDPNYVDANINLGGLILNKGIEHWNETNNKRDLTQQQYDAELAVAQGIFDEAYPYLQKAVDVDGSNVIALSNLQKYYQIKDDQAKVDELQAKIDALN